MCMCMCVSMCVCVCVCVRVYVCMRKSGVRVRVCAPEGQDWEHPSGTRGRDSQMNMGNQRSLEALD